MMRTWHYLINGAAFLCLVLPLAASAGSDKPQQSLLEAAKNNDVKTVRRLLEGSAYANYQSADGSTALHWAVLNNEPDIAGLLLQSGAKPDPRNDFGVTPLWLACTNRNSDMVELLLQAGADPNAALQSGETVLMECSRTGDVESVKSLLSNGAEVNAAESNKKQTALMWAVAERHSEVVRLLIDHGADISAKTVSTVATLQHTCRICEWKITSGGFTPLLFAARSGDLGSARLLLEAGADPNEATAIQGNSLVIAAAGGHAELALYLLKMGADPNSADETGITALHHAVGAGLSYLNGVIYDPVYRIRPANHMKLARALLEAGADVNVRIKKEHLLGPDGYPFNMEGATPLLLAAASTDIPLMKLFQEFGADPQINTVEGVTPLMAAAQAACTGACAYQEGGNVANEEAIQSALQGVMVTLEMGIDINAASKEGLTAIHIAAFTGADPIIKYLVEHGAKVNVKNNRGETPWSMASGLPPEREETGIYGLHESTVALLLELGATKMTADEILAFQK